MKTFILIVTLIVNGGNDGQGGVAMQDFVGQASCDAAGKQWLSKVNTIERWGTKSFYICVKKTI